MVILEDLQKLLLYQKLNLGYDCDVCKRKFYNKLDYLDHMNSCKKDEHICLECGKTFSHEKILQLHMHFHNLGKTTVPVLHAGTMKLPDSNDNKISLVCGGSRDSERTTPQPSFLQHQAISSMVESLLKSNESQMKNNLPPIKILESPKKLPTVKTKGKSKPVKKNTGLTKVRMEDCLRCDACSCIYIDDKDYYKHMRNFHQVDVANNLPVVQQKPKRKCRSCCKQCRGANCTSVKRPRATQQSSNLIFKINMQNNIQDRWTRMVSQQLLKYPMPEFQSVQDIKPDLDTITIKPDPDFSHLLSQVEVKIKTEPTDEYCV